MYLCAFVYIYHSITGTKYEKNKFPCHVFGIRCIGLSVSEYQSQHHPCSFTNRKRLCNHKRSCNCNRLCNPNACRQMAGTVPAHPCSLDNASASGGTDGSWTQPM